MFDPIIFSSKAIGGAFASIDGTEELLAAVDCSLMAFQIAGGAKVSNAAAGDGAFVRPLMFVHVPLESRILLECFLFGASRMLTDIRR